MKQAWQRLAACRRGASAIEFALAVPVLALFLAGLAQLGVLFAANAGLKEAVDEGARYASIYPRPSDASIISRVQARGFALKAADLATPVLTHGTSNGLPYVDISASYTARTSFILFTGPTVVLTSTRRAYQN